MIVSPQHAVLLGWLYVRWHLTIAPSRIVKLWFEEIRALHQLFPILFLVRTLLAPWKCIVDAYPRKGFDLLRILETWTFNIVTRLIGAIIRIVAIVFGLACFGAMTVVFVAVLVVHLFFPIFFVLGILYLVGSLPIVLLW